MTPATCALCPNPATCRIGGDEDGMPVCEAHRDSLMFEREKRLLGDVGKAAK